MRHQSSIKIARFCKKPQFCDNQIFGQPFDNLFKFSQNVINNSEKQVMRIKKDHLEQMRVNSGRSIWKICMLTSGLQHLTCPFYRERLSLFLLILQSLVIEWFSLESRKIKAKALRMANHSKCKQHIKQSGLKPNSANRWQSLARPSRGWFCFWLSE